MPYSLGMSSQSHDTGIRAKGRPDMPNEVRHGTLSIDTNISSTAGLEDLYLWQRH